MILTEVVGRLPYASNATLVATDRSGQRWVYKPVRGERPLWDFPDGTLAAREVLTYQASQAMGLGIVPETVMADGPFGPGSAQRFIDEDPDFDPRPLFAPSGPDQRLWPFAVLDLVTNNADRKLGHLIKEAAIDRLWGIDNGLTFHPGPKLRTVLWGFAGHPIPPHLVAAVKRLDDHPEFWEGSGQLLGAPETEATRRRVRAILDEPVHPHPPADRPPVPWPVW